MPEAVTLLKELPEFGPMSAPSVHLALAIAAAKLNVDSHYKPWMRVLPDAVPSWLHTQEDQARSSIMAHPELSDLADDFVAEVTAAQLMFERQYEELNFHAAMCVLATNYAEDAKSETTQKELFAWAMAIVCSRAQSVGDNHGDPMAMYPLLDMANCPDEGKSTAEHFNLPQPSSAEERACRDEWYRQAGVVDSQGLDEDRLIFQELWSLSNSRTLPLTPTQTLLLPRL